jgi:purine-nucleoside/S-methyl-5'-thioadenosine phosphorylase / adenosine deaminase
MDTTQDEVPFWRPSRFPVPAWFGMATRAGGVSVGPYATLNLSLGVGDDEAAVRENRRRLRAAAHVPDGGPTMLHQVHGRTIVGIEDGGRDADGFVVAPGDPWAGVSAADCAPVALVAEDGSAGALVHCGWRGARDGIGPAAVERLGERGIMAARLVAAIGPCLHACCFPIGPEVAAEFDPAFLKPHPTGQPSLDLPGAIAAALVGAGVPAARIEVASECTACDPERFFSHRRDRGLTGRHWALLRLSPRP